MNTMKKTVELSPEDLAILGEGALGYIREIEVQEAKRLLGGEARCTEFTTVLPLQCRWHAGVDLRIARSGRRQRLRA
jgi:hypothetical protein